MWYNDSIPYRLGRGIPWRGLYAPKGVHMKKYSKLLALLLAVLMVGAATATTLAGILPAAAEGNI